MGPGGFRGLQIRWAGPCGVGRRVRFPCASATMPWARGGPLVSEEGWMAANEPIFHGALAEVALPQILATIHRHRVPGVVECARRSDRKQIYFLDGDVIFATSSDREESLGEYLLMKGRISRSQLDVASREVGRFPGRRLGAILVQMGFLGAHEVAIAIREQGEQIVWGLFNWNHGAVEFRAGRGAEHEGQQVAVSTPRVVM